jgi:hypothetical protein
MVKKRKAHEGKLDAQLKEWKTRIVVLKTKREVQ